MQREFNFHNIITFLNDNCLKFSDTTLARWDNEPHYPELDNFPHHYHFREEIKESPLTGVPIKDINEVMIKISKIITNEDV